MPRTRFHEESGAVAVMVAIFVIAFVALSAIVVDVGYMYDTRRQLQAIAEAAALAGCQELIRSGGDAAAADAEARDYAALNAEVGPVDGLVIEDVAVDVGEGSVRVVVAQPSPAFFSRLFGPATNTVRAAAKAQKWLLTGGRFLVPWAIPTIRHVDYVEAAIVDGKGDVLSSAVLGKTGTLTYAGALSAPAAAGGYDVRVRVYNTYGVYEALYDSASADMKDAPAGRVTVGSTQFASVSLSDDFVTWGDADWPLLSVETLAPVAGTLKLKIGKQTRNMTSADGIHWTYQFSPDDVDSSATGDLLRVYAVDVFTGGKGDGVDAYLHVRRSTHPISGVSVSPMAVGPGGTVDVTVELSEFYPTTAIPGQTYVLCAGQHNGEAGNFGQLNFNKIEHTGACPPDPYDPASGNRYAEWIEYGYEGGVHVGDVIPMSPGAQPHVTYTALKRRQDKVVCVPVVEKIVDKGTGEYDVIVETFAAFRIISFDLSGTVVGEFLEYVANPSSYDPDSGGDPNAIYAARLVNP